LRLAYWRFGLAVGCARVAVAVSAGILEHRQGTEFGAKKPAVTSNTPGSMLPPPAPPPKHQAVLEDNADYRDTTFSYTATLQLAIRRFHTGRFAVLGLDLSSSPPLPSSIAALVAVDWMQRSPRVARQVGGFDMQQGMASSPGETLLFLIFEILNTIPLLRYLVGATLVP